MKRVIVESPYAGDVERNIRYARAAMKDCLLRREAPYASHLLYTQEGVLDDKNPAERKLGMEAGFAWGAVADYVVVYTDLGITDGMKLGIEKREGERRSIKYRTLPCIVLTRLINETE